MLMSVSDVRMHSRNESSTSKCRCSLAATFRHVLHVQVSGLSKLNSLH
jgi:hypothetical protein